VVRFSALRPDGRDRFCKLHFHSSDPLTGTLQSFAVFAVGFAARPIGAAIFGHYGDRIGRKAALIATLLLTGLSTCRLRTNLRADWHLGRGGTGRLALHPGGWGRRQWSGSVLLSMEWARTSENRGVIAAWPQFGAPAGFFLANVCDPGV